MAEESAGQPPAKHGRYESAPAAARGEQPSYASGSGTSPYEREVQLQHLEAEERQRAEEQRQVQLEQEAVAAKQENAI